MLLLSFNVEDGVSSAISRARIEARVYTDSKEKLGHAPYTTAVIPGD